MQTILFEDSLQEVSKAIFSPFLIITITDVEGQIIYLYIMIQKYPVYTFL